MFTDLEYVLMIAIAVLLWRNAKLDQAETDAINSANKYANFLIRIGKGEGTVVRDGDEFRFKEKK